MSISGISKYTEWNDYTHEKGEFVDKKVANLKDSVDIIKSGGKKRFPNTINAIKTYKVEEGKTPKKIAVLKEYIKGEKGLLSEEFRGNVNAMYEKVKNSQLVSEKLNTLKVLADSLGDKNPKIKKMLEDVESKMKEDIKNSTNSATSTTEGQTKNINHTINFTPTAPYMDVMNREFTKQPDIFNEWAERNVKEFTTPNTAVKN